MPRPTWHGRRATNAVAACLRTHGTTCWLCHHPGATSLDHIHPASTHPHLEWEPTNHRPAHLTKAGTEHGCQHPGCTCPGNKGRKAQPWTAPPSRTWLVLAAVLAQPASSPAAQRFWPSRRRVRQRGIL